LEGELLLQFSIEAVVLSPPGGVVGVVGVVIATAASYGGTLLMGVPCAFDPTINVVALVFSAAIGMVFGYFPAKRAAQMDPMEALRHE
jgi:putative ABC transport system permease protein